MLENMHDLPWLRREQLMPETVASMARVGAAVRRDNPSIPMGLQILTCGNIEAMAVAKVTGEATILKRHCGLVVSAPTWDGTGWEFDSWQYIPCSLSLRLLGSLRGFCMGTYGLTQKLC